MHPVDTHTAEIPPLERLPEDGLEAIHEAAMYIIEELGIQLNHDRALEEYDEAGADVDWESNLVKAPRDLVLGLVESAPSQFTVHGRDPDKTATAGGDSVVRAPAYGPPNIRTLEDGRRESTLDDYEDLIKLCHMEEPIDSTGYNVCEPNDVAQEVKHLEMLKRSLTLSDMPVMSSVYGADRAQESLEMIGIAVDDPDLSKPYTAGLVNTVPPRSIDTKMLGGLVTYAEHGQPVIVASFNMPNASAPATMPMALAQGTAENLVGIGLTQLINEGNPVTFGAPSNPIDIRYGTMSAANPEVALSLSAIAQLAHHYGVPAKGNGCVSDSKVVDYQSGVESMMIEAFTGLSNIDYNVHTAGILGSYSSISPEKFVLDCETVRLFDVVQDGFDIANDDFPFDLLGEVEPSGHFLNKKHTLQKSQENFVRSTLFDKLSYDDWADEGSKSAFERGRERVDELLDDYERPSMDADIESDLERYVDDAVSQAL